MCYQTIQAYHRPIPLSTLQSGKCHIKWTKCADLPCKMKSISIVTDTERKKIYASTNDSTVPCCVFCYELVSHQWMHLPKLQHYRCVLLMCNGQLNAIGGYDSKSHILTKAVSTFCETTKNWVSTYPDLFKARLKPGAISYLDHMMVAGGYIDKIHIADDIEILDSTQQPLIWKSCAVQLPMHMWALKFAICEKNLYIVGYNDSRHTKANAFRIPANALISSPNANSKLCANTPNWLVLPPAPYFRAGLASTSVLLMVAGGSSTSSKLTSDVFRFDRFNNEWKIIGSLSSPKADVAMCTINDTIIVIGGYSRGGSMEASEESSLSTMEMGQVEIN